LPEDQVKELDRLMEETKLSTRKDLFNNALTLFQWAVKAKRAGRIIASIDEESGTSKELVMPALENVPTARRLVGASYREKQ
jgi:metal-responsive CopG/Arc/MetJ family transcriptional regulator